MSRRALLVPVAILLALAGILGPNFYNAMQRARQKRTMADMHTAWSQIEKGQRPASRIDAWGHPMRFHLEGTHRSIRAAARDGRFQPMSPQTIATEGWDDDIVMMDGRFIQFPNGICAYDEPGKGPLGDCASCHPRHIAK